MTVNGAAAETTIDAILRHCWGYPVQEAVFAACPYSAGSQSISQTCSPLLTGLGFTADKLKPGISITGPDVTAILLNQSLDYFQKGLYNFLAQYMLARRGYITWAKVTNYYASFFSIHSLLCLQGQTITRVELAGETQRCHLIATNLAAHEYALTVRGLGVKGGEHRISWRRFFDVYDKFTHPAVTQFEVVHRVTYQPDPFDESDYRNDINYVPFEGFNEMIDAVELAAFEAMYSGAIATPTVGRPLNDYLTTLQALSTDPNFKYFARVALRLLLVGDLLKRFSACNAVFAAEWARRLTLWDVFCKTVTASPPLNFFETMPQLLN